MFPFLYSRMGMKSGVPGESGSTIYIDDYKIKDDQGRVIYRREQTTVDLLGAMLNDIVLSLDNDEPKTAEDSLTQNILGKVMEQMNDNIKVFENKIRHLCTDDSVKLDNGSNAIFNHYLPFYTRLLETDHLATASYLINNFRAQYPEKVEAWFKENPERSDAFFEWRSEFYKD